MPAGTKYHNLSYDYNQSQFIAVGEHLANTFNSGIALMDWKGEKPIPPTPPIPPEPPVPDEWIDSGFRVTQTLGCGNTVEVSNVQFN